MGGDKGGGKGGAGETSRETEGEDCKTTAAEKAANYKESSKGRDAMLEQMLWA